MIEQNLVEFGILGIWTGTLLYEKYNGNKQMKQAVDNNTIATNRLSQIIELKGLK